MAAETVTTETTTATEPDDGAPTARRTNAHGQPIGPALPGWTPPPHPPWEAMEGRYCRIEPQDPARHGDALHAAFAADAAGRIWTYRSEGPFASRPDFDAWLEATSGQDDPMVFAFIDLATGKAVGSGAYMRIAPEAACIEVGSLLFSPLMQRTRVATEAMYLMMRRAFELGYRRYEWKCDALNEPSCRAARRFGFTYEGTFRQALVYKGRNRDTAWFSIIDSEWPALRRGFEAWLDPANFDSEGTQKQRLGEFFSSSL